MAGSLWERADYRYPLLVRVDRGTREGAIWADFPADEDEYVDLESAICRGPRAIATGLGSVWVLPSEGDRLVRIDAGSGASESYELPFRLADISAGPGAVFGIGSLAMVVSRASPWWQVLRPRRLGMPCG